MDGMLIVRIVGMGLIIAAAVAMIAAKQLGPDDWEYHDGDDGPGND